jgi:chromosome segregation protein
MFFKRLEVFGFKSFAEKTVVDFEAGVTAIVGPNGCGKSNLSDSIKWVLGEQSVRSIRGAKMEDVIFHGADNIAGVGFAEVSLTISNQKKLLPLDYEEITVTRRIFRSGESEYLINKIPVRLKDIQELLMGTGMGMRSYSVMEQGKVDQILSAKPQDRRDVFEEASGITKYKSKKEESLRKLERTRENLQRLGDIVVEVRRQIKSMERQVNKARRYKEEFEKLKGYELKISHYQYRDFRKEKQALGTQLKELQARETALTSKINSLNDTLEKTKQDLSKIEDDFSGFQAESYEVNASINTANSKRKLNQERIGELAGRKEDILQQLGEFEKKIAATGEQLQDARERIKLIEQEKEAKSSFLAKKEENIQMLLNSVDEMQKKLSEEKSQQVEFSSRESKLKNELVKLQANVANVDARLRRLNVETEKTHRESSEIQEKERNCNEEIESLKEQLSRLTVEIEQLKNGREAKLKQRQKVNLRLEEAFHQLASLQSRVDFLKEMTSKYEGFSGGVKAILSAIDEKAVKIEGFCGVVADLVEVSAEYQFPIEMALGENAEAIVVKNIQAAYAALKYLKSKDAGRANFICLDNLTSNREKGAAPRKALGKAMEFVKAAPQYRKLLEYLLANTFIVQDLETACSALADTGPSGRLVTLNGEVVSKRLIVGGSLPRDSHSSLLGRRERIEQAEEKIEAVKAEKGKLKHSKAVCDAEIKELDGSIHRMQPDLDEIKISLANKENEKAGIETEEQRFKDEVSVLKLEIEETGEERKQLQEEKDELEQKLVRLEEKKEELRGIILNCQDYIAEKNQEYQNALVEIAESKAKASALNREEEDARLRLEMIAQSQADQKQTLQSRAEELKDSDIRRRELQQEITQLELQNKKLSQTKLSVEEKLNQAMGRRRKFSAVMKDLEARSKETQRELDEARAKMAGQQVRLTEANLKQDSLRDKMQQSYQVNLDEALSESEELSPAEPYVFDEIQRLKERLQGMGPVNLVAIEENEQLQQRYSFLVSQQEDLTNAEESLRKAITHINHTARKVFAETFEKIQVNFRDYFRVLFNGGDARLILVDENNILESGIEIVVRPPGKKLQNISLLSGGEKALTAIGLLFALFKVKPSPFCILDEVDAPLDESNVDRFTNLLSEFIKTSQFIIVTHNKKTINMADIMYGITMEKSGVSKIVSVRLTEEKEPAVEEPLPA